MDPKTGEPTWEESVRNVRGAFSACKTAEDVRNFWRLNMSLGHKTLGRILIYSDEQLERMIAKREGE